MSTSAPPPRPPAESAVVLRVEEAEAFVAEDLPLGGG